MGPVSLSLLQTTRLALEWRVGVGQMVVAGETAAAFHNPSGAVATTITIPRAGMISDLSGLKEDDVLLEGPLFTMLYYEDGAAISDPFVELRKYFEGIRTTLMAEESALKSTVGFMKLVIGVAAVLVGFVVALAGSITGSGIIVALALVAYCVIVLPKEKELNKVRRGLQKFPRQ
jgi:hypothetical protein